MRSIDFLLHRLATTPAEVALVWGDREYTSRDLLDRIDHWYGMLAAEGIEPGDVVALEGDYSPNTIGALLALLGHDAIVVPLARASPRRAEQLTIAAAERSVLVSPSDEVELQTLDHDGRHELYALLRERRHPGLVLFTSGSSGSPKAAVHDVPALLEKFHAPRAALRTLNFLLFDHWGGLNTLFHAISNGSPVVTVVDRRPDAICETIERFGVELLPASPSFLNLLLVSRAHTRHDLSSLKVVTYGSEPMPAHTLVRLAEAFPNVKLQQTYGLIELGVLRSQSRERDSLWVRVGGDGYETRVRDGLLEIRARSAMLGYLNAPSPFTRDGWFMTGDAVEQDGEWLRILGRRSELISVGGEKAYPAEIESVIEELDGVVEARVYATRNVLLGNVVCADVRLAQPEPSGSLRARVKAHCAGRLPPYMVPVKIEVVESELFSDRLKKRRADRS